MKKNRIFFIVGLLAAALVAPVAQAQNLVSGQTLYKNNCQSCHAAMTKTNKKNRIHLGADYGVIAQAIGSNIGGMGIPTLEALSTTQLQNIAGYIAAVIAGTPITPPTTGAGLSVTPNALAFGSVQIANAGVQTITLKNLAASTVNLSAPTITPAVFTQTNNCPPTLIGNAECTLTVSFKPTANGVVNGTLNLTSTATPATYAVALSGSGSPQAVPAVSLSSGTVNFADAIIGSAATSQTLNLKNAGPGVAVVQSVAVSGVDDFAVSGCATGTSLAAGASCPLAISFTPKLLGARAATLTVTADQGISVAAGINGQVIAVPLALSVDGLDFDATANAANLQSQKITLTNNGATPMLFKVVVPAPFLLGASSTCPVPPAALAPGASCNLELTYLPASNQPVNASMTIQIQGLTTPLTVPLNAIAPNNPTTNVGGGGCSIGSNERPDPLLWLLALLAAVQLWRGRRVLRTVQVKK